MLQAFWLFICEDFTDADQPRGIFFSAVTQLCFHLTQPSQEKIEYQTSRRWVFIAMSPNAESHQSNGSHWFLWRLISNWSFHILHLQNSVLYSVGLSQTSHSVIMSWERETLPPSVRTSKWTLKGGVKIALHNHFNLKMQKYDTHL